MKVKFSKNKKIIAALGIAVLCTALMTVGILKLISNSREESSSVEALEKNKISNLFNIRRAEGDLEDDETSSSSGTSTGQGSYSGTTTSSSSLASTQQSDSKTTSTTKNPTSSDIRRPSSSNSGTTVTPTPAEPTPTVPTNPEPTTPTPTPSTPDSNPEPTQPEVPETPAEPPTENSDGKFEAVTGSSFTITIKEPESNILNHTYKAYKIFGGDLSKNSSNKYVLSNIEWGNGVDLNKKTEIISELNKLLNTDIDKKWETAAQVADYLSTLNDNHENLSKFAKIINSSSFKGTGIEGSKKSNGVFTITVSEPGYYLIIDENATEETPTVNNIYSRFILKVIADQVIEIKSDLPTLKKIVGNSVKPKSTEGGETEVEEYNYIPADGMNDHNNTASIGNIVPFKIIGNFPDLKEYDKYQYIVHETLSEGFTFNNDVTMKIVEYEKNVDGEVINENVLITLENGDFSVSVAPDDSKNITITFDKILDKYKSSKSLVGKTIVIEYTATLNENAKKDATANTNQSYLNYSNNPRVESSIGQTPIDTTNTYVFFVNLNKVDLKDRENDFIDSANEGGRKHYIQGLKGAEFDLYDATDFETPIISGIKTDEYGVADLPGVSNGTYYLKETKAPAGYNNLLGNVKFTIKTEIGDDGELVFQLKTIQNDDGTKTDNSNVTAEVENDLKNSLVRIDIDNGQIYLVVTNSTGAQLPITGGIGTVIFTIVGLSIMVIAVIALTSNKRK